ncbi:RNA polymerase II transcription factor B subunit 1 [Apiospora arundinis]
MATAEAPPPLTNIANKAATSVPPLQLKACNKRDEDEDDDDDASSVINSNGSMPDAVQVSSPSSSTVRPPLPATPARLMNIDLNYESPLSRLKLTPFRYGHGTELHPITEQRSIATLRNGMVSTPELEATNRSKSKNHFLLTKSIDENGSSGLKATPGSRRSLRRQHTFSLDSGKSHLLSDLSGSENRNRRPYEQILHRKENTSVSSYSSTPTAGGGRNRGTIDSARILAELKSYPHALSHPDSLLDLQSQGRHNLPSPSGTTYPQPRSAHGGDLSRHPFVMGTFARFPPPTITATPPDRAPGLDRSREGQRQPTPTTAARLGQLLGIRPKGPSTAPAARSRNATAVNSNDNNHPRYRRHLRRHPSARDASSRPRSPGASSRVSESDSDAADNSNVPAPLMELRRGKKGGGPPRACTEDGAAGLVLAMHRAKGGACRAVLLGPRCSLEWMSEYLATV